MLDLEQEYKAISLIRPQVATSTVTGTGVDLGPDYEDDAVAIFNLGAASDTDSTCIVTIEGSDAVGGTYAVLGTFSTATASSDNKLGMVKITTAGAANRFIRAKATIASTGSPSFAIDVILLVRATVASADLNSATLA